MLFCNHILSAHHVLIVTIHGQEKIIRVVFLITSSAYNNKYGTNWYLLANKRVICACTLYVALSH